MKRSYTVLTGLAGAGKTAYCIDLFRKHIQESGSGLDSQSYFVLPSREHADRIQFLLLKDVLKGLFNAHVITLDELRLRLYGPRACVTVSDPLRQALIEQVLGLNQGSWKYFNSASSQVLSPMLSETLKEFIDSGSSTGQFRKRAKILLKEASFKAKFDDFCLLVEQYQKILEDKGLSEEAQSSKLSAEQTLTSADLVILDGFYHFGDIQRTFLKSVLNSTQKMLVTLTLPKDYLKRNQAFYYSHQTLLFLEALGFARKSIDSPSQRFFSPGLHLLESRLFQDKLSAPQETTSDVQILQAPNFFEEARMIACAIREMYTQESYQFSDFCVISRAANHAQAVLEVAFREHDIPVYVHERIHLVDEPPGLFVKKVLDLCLSDWLESDMIAIVRMIFSDAGNATSDIITAIKASDVKSDSPKKSGALWKERVSIASIAEEQKNRLSRLLDLISQLEQSKDYQQFARILGDLFNFMYLKSGHTRLSTRGEKARMTFTMLLKDQMKYWQDSSIYESWDAASVMELMRSTIESSLFSCKPADKNRVQVYDCVMAMVKEFKVVFVCGLNEGTFPRFIRQDIVFKDAERKVLSEDAYQWAPRALRAHGEKFFFYMAVTRAQQKLFLSYSTFNLQAQASSRSYFVDCVESCFAPGSVKMHSRPQAKRALSEPGQCLSSRQALMSALYYLGPHEKVHSIFSRSTEARGNWMALLAEGLRLHPAREHVQSYLKTPIALKLTQESVLRGIKEQKHFSPTRLENAAACLFRYYCYSHLQLNEDSVDREAPDKGTLIHAVLENYFREKAHNNKSITINGPLDMYQELLKHYEYQIQTRTFFSYYPSYKKNLCLRDVRKSLKAFARREWQLSQARQLVPTYFELDFGRGSESTLPALELESASGSVLIRGSIDRVDLDSSGTQALVVDYKRSKRSVTLRKKLEKGLELQLPIYMLVVDRILRKKNMGAELRYINSASEDGLYASPEIIPSKSKKTIELDLEALDALKLKAENRVLSLIDNIREGTISVNPMTCEYCRFAPVCRFEKWKLAYENTKGQALI